MKIYHLLFAGALALVTYLSYSKSKTLEKELASQRQLLGERHATAMVRIEKLDGAAASLAPRFESLSRSLAEQQKGLDANTRSDSQQRETLAALKADVAKGAESAFTQEVVRATAEAAIKTVVEKKMLVQEPRFLSAVARVLGENFRPELQGPAGADADNAVVAKLLLADPEFLNRVSVSALLEQK